jgi:hypothetical protein
MNIDPQTAAILIAFGALIGFIAGRVVFPAVPRVRYTRPATQSFGEACTHKWSPWMRDGKRLVRWRLPMNGADEAERAANNNPHDIDMTRRAAQQARSN